MLEGMFKEAKDKKNEKSSQKDVEMKS